MMYDKVWNDEGNGEAYETGVGGQVDTVGGVGVGEGHEEGGDSMETAEEIVLGGGGRKRTG